MAFKLRGWSSRSALLLATAFLVSGFLAWPARAADTMPPLAPPIHARESVASPDGVGDHSKPDEASAAADGSSALPASNRQTTAVQPHPLSGGVSRFGADDEPARQLLQGKSSYVITTPSPVINGNASTQKVLPRVFQAWIEKGHPKFSLKAASLPPGDVLEVKGTWDDSARTLRSLGIPFTHIRSAELKDYPLQNVKVLILNCAGKEPKESYQRVRDWVAAGGYLLTTDWALDNFVQKVFPGYIEWNRKTNRQPIYDAQIATPDPVLYQNTVTQALWKLDEDSHLVRIVNPSVRVLVRSRILSTQDPDHQGILAVTFPFGRGQVLHLVGHFDNNAFFAFTNMLNDPAPLIGISLRQALAANFVVAGLEGDHIPVVQANP